MMPWPFRAERLEVRFPGFTIPGERFENTEELDEALELAEPGEIGRAHV